MATTNGPLIDLQYLLSSQSYMGDLKARNKMCLRPIDIAKMHGYKDCVNYLATLEACLSLAEENIALETELLHYGAELSELEKCFNELLQLAKTERSQVQGSYFGSVVEAIERKWKRCKSKTLGSHGIPNQNAFNLFQSHFSRVLTDDVLSEVSFSSSSNHHHHQSFFQQHQHNIHNRLFNHHGIHNNRFMNNEGSDNLSGLLGGDRSKKKCNSNGSTSIYNDPFLELSNGHYSLFSTDTDYAVPCKLKNGTKNKVDTPKKENPIVLGRRGLKQQRDQSEGSSVPSYPKSSKSLYEYYKHHIHSSSSPPSALRDVKSDFEDIDLDLDLDDEDDDELSGYSSLKIRPSPQTSSNGSKGSSSNRQSLDQTDSQHSSKSKESPRGSIGITENLSEPESKTSDGRESSANESVSNKESYSGAGDIDSASVSRKRGFLHKFSLKKWATTASKPKKSYSKETLLRSTSGEGVREEVKSSSNEMSSNEDASEKDNSCKPSICKDENEKKSGNCWPDGSSHEIQSEDVTTTFNERARTGSRGAQETPKSPSSTSTNQSTVHQKTIKSSIPSSSFHRKIRRDTCQNVNPNSGESAKNYVNYGDGDIQQIQTFPQGVDRSQSPINKLNYCRLTNDKIRSSSMDGIDIKPEANHHPNQQCHYDNHLSSVSNDIYKTESANQPEPHHLNTDKYSLIATSKSNSIIKESKLFGGCSKLTNNQNELPHATINDTSKKLLTDCSHLDGNMEALTSAQSVPILSNSVYGVKHVKKAKIKELAPLNYEELTSTSSPPPPSSSINNVTTSKFFESRRKMFEKGPGNKNTRGLRRRRNGNRAWYDVSDDEDGLVPQKFDQEKLTETQEVVDCGQSINVLKPEQL